MRSMTGFGKSVCELPQKKITIEIRSLNSKQLDLNIRMPSLYRDKEPEIRSELSKFAERGKVDCTIFAEGTSDSGLATINHTLARAYYKELKTISQEIGEERKDFLSLIVKMPDVMKQDKIELDEDEWKTISGCLKIAMDAFGKFRDDEGKVLEGELTARIGNIHMKLDEVAKLDPSRAIAVRERLQKNLQEMAGAENVDKNRFEQELIYYLEKLDITEEKLRLQTHLDYFIQTMKEQGAGRKLGFIAQEIGREINTIGSKANDAGIQMIVVQMKDELEKIKEQLLNVLQAGRREKIVFRKIISNTVVIGKNESGSTEKTFAESPGYPIALITLILTNGFNRQIDNFFGSLRRRENYDCPFAFEINSHS